METEEKLMTGEESLKIITDMINKTKINIRQSSFHLLFWGWLLFFCSLSEYLLYKFTDYATPWYIWFFVVPGIIVSMAYGFIKGRRESVFTYATRIYVFTWIAFLISGIMLFILLGDQYQFISPLILSLAAMPTFISGIIIKFRPLILGAVSFWLFALLAKFGGPDLASLAVPAAMLTGYLIPGYILRNRNGHGTV